MTPAITVALSWTLSPGGTYPFDSGWQSGSLSTYNDAFFFQWQTLSEATGFQWVNYGERTASAYSYPEHDYDEEKTHFGPTCLDLLTGVNNPDIPLQIGNPNPYGGTLTPIGTNGVPLVKPSGWPDNVPWPPWLPPGGQTNINLNADQLASIGVSNVNQITWNYTPGPPPVMPTTVWVTNVTSYTTNANGTNLTVYVTNTVGTVGGFTGLPSQAGATNGTEILSLAQLESLHRLETNTLRAANYLQNFTNLVFTNIVDTNGLPEPVHVDVVNAQKALAVEPSEAFGELFNVSVHDGSVSLAGSAPSITFPNGAGGTMAFSLNSDALLPLSDLRPFVVWFLYLGLAYACWLVLEDRVKMMMGAIPATSVENSLGGTRFWGSAAALGVAAGIVLLWTLTTAAIMGYASFTIFNDAPDVSALAVGAWLNNFAPINEMFAVIFSYIAFRVVSMKLAAICCAAIKYIVGA